MSEYTREELEQMVHSDDWEDRETAAENGVGLDILVNDEYAWVRIAVAKQGRPQDLAILVDDKHEWVRVVVAKQGYGLDKLINDEDYTVRIAVAKQGYGLDILVYDKDRDVRVAVAEQGYGLEKLVNDKAVCVRRAVAQQGRIEDLDILIHDKNKDVRNLAKTKMEELGYRYIQVSKWVPTSKAEDFQRYIDEFEK